MFVDLKTVVICEGWGVVDERVLICVNDNFVVVDYRVLSG